MRTWVRTIDGAAARTARATRVVRVAAGALAAGMLATVAIAPPAANAAPIRPSNSEQLGGQRLVWGTCPGVDDTRLRCTTVRVPLDHARPTNGRSITLTVSRLSTADPALRRGVLFTAGGGPGGAGVPEPLYLSSILDPSVLARYDIVGFDMRFVERSTPISCGQPQEEPGGYWARTATYQSFAQTVREAQAYARDCARHAGWALPYATTAQAARDMDVIRAALGERKISFLAGSYAAMLGSTYRALFPHRVDRFVLDSPINHERIWRRYDLERLPAFEENYAAFAAYVADNSGTYGLGSTAAEVTRTLSQAFARAAVEPIVIGDHAWTASELGTMAVVATYFDYLWPVVALDLAAILAGSPPPIPLDLYPAPLPGTPGVPPDNHTAVNMAFRCGDNAWPRDLATYRRDLATYSVRHPVFGPTIANLNPCAFWPVARDNRVPLADDQAPAALVVAATHDASVPLPNSVAVARANAGSRLVTVDRRVHVPFVGGQGDDCLTGAVTDFLVTGRLPARDLAC